MNKLILLLFLFLTNNCFAEDNILLNIDVKIPANQDYVDLPIVQIDGPIKKNHIGYGIHIYDWIVKNYITRIHLKEKLNHPAIIKKNTLIVFDGRYEIEKTVHGTFAHKFFVKEPKEIEYVACGVYLDHYRSLMGENVKLIKRSFPENYK